MQHQPMPEDLQRSAKISIDQNGLKSFGKDRKVYQWIKKDLKVFVRIKKEQKVSQWIKSDLQVFQRIEKDHKYKAPIRNSFAI